MKVDVWILSRHDTGGMFALAFPTLHELVEHVQDYYYGGEDAPAAVSDGGGIDAFATAIGADMGMSFAINHSVLTVGNGGDE